MSSPGRSIVGAKKEGYLTKEGGRVKSWKRRWFVLGKETLSYYKTHKALKKVLGVIPLREVLKVTAIDHKKNPYMFTVVTPRRSYLIYADSRLIMKEWLDIIDEQLDIVFKNNKHVSLEAEPLQDPYEQTEQPNLESFDLLQIIGQGSFGKVCQVRMKESGDVYAMKVLNKKHIVDRGEIEHTRAEQSILKRVDHPFLMKMHWSFQSDEKLYIIMDFVNGGELFFHLQNEKKFTNERARFYSAEIILGISYLHSLGIIYRDLKPENLLLDDSGHIKMTDFGLSKEGLLSLDDRTNTFCGTPEYLAPEVLDGKNYTKSVDWWSLGTLIFEMLTGLPPFYDEDVQKMYNKKMTDELVVPSFIEPPAAIIIERFLRRDPTQRLDDVAEIKAEIWFEVIDWTKLESLQVSPPYRPDVESKESTQLIDMSFTAMDVHKEIKASSQVVSGDQFEGFTYDRNT
eukprot:TRINITY_DN2386_c0_g1_i1.p1 TRINITY_DN2386_c0_g1~~TRINITY_DN2386_c0_g1_i1.p1  ORF type:complete len:456 (+),score=99.70 TRINITY_DN2386_c0_g1_i1:117-1484(+)